MNRQEKRRIDREKNKITRTLPYYLEVRRTKEERRAAAEAALDEQEKNSPFAAVIQAKRKRHG